MAVCAHDHAHLALPMLLNVNAEQTTWLSPSQENMHWPAFHYWRCCKMSSPHRTHWACLCCSWMSRNHESSGCPWGLGRLAVWRLLWVQWQAHLGTAVSVFRAFWSRGENRSPTGCSSGPHRWQCGPAVQPTHFHTKLQISVNIFSQLELQTGGIGKLFQSQHSHSNLSSHLLVKCSTGHLQW